MAPGTGLAHAALHMLARSTPEGNLLLYSDVSQGAAIASQYTIAESDDGQGWMVVHKHMH